MPLPLDMLRLLEGLFLWTVGLCYGEHWTYFTMIALILTLPEPWKIDYEILVVLEVKPTKM